MDTKSLQAELCKGFRIQSSPSGSLSVVTPLVYEDGDHIVLFISNTQNQQFRIDDNGEAAFRLMTEGLDLERGKVSEWIASLSKSYGVHWDSDQDELFATAASPSQVADAIARVAECSAQMQALSALRVERKQSTFKEEVLKVLAEIERETQVQVKYDVPVDPDHQLIVDAYFLSKTPLAVVIASSTERLLEAELMWTNARRLGDPMRLIAVIEDVDKIGTKQVMRANYFTDKTVQFRNMAKAFHGLVRDELKH